MINRIRTIKKRWFAVTAAVALLAVGLAAGSVAAAGIGGSVADGPFQRGNGHHDNRGGYGDPDALMTRVAEILGVEPAALEAAFITAMDEQAAVAFNTHIDALVVDETLTQEQGDEATIWFQSRPEGTGPMGLHFSHRANSDDIDSWLSHMVEMEELTQEEADDIRAWHNSRPAFLDDIDDDGPFGEGRKRHRHHDDDGSSDNEGNAG